MKTEHQEYTKQQVVNAVRWIDALDPKNGYHKTINHLGVLCDPRTGWKSVKDHKNELQFCCLGVACHVLGFHEQDPYVFTNSYSGQQRLGEPLGFIGSSLFFDNADTSLPTAKRIFIKGHEFSYNSLVDINDYAYKGDTDFKNVRAFILDHLEYIFLPEVAKGIKEHYDFWNGMKKEGNPTPTFNV